MHLALARALERDHRRDVEILAHHYVMGGDNERACVYLEQAGDRAAAIYANELAAANYKASLSRLDDIERARQCARVLVKLARVLDLLAETDDALQQLEGA